MLEDQVSDSPRCGGGIKTREVALRAQAIALENVDKIDKIKNRLPVWATMFIGFLTMIIGATMAILVTSASK